MAYQMVIIDDQKENAVVTKAVPVQDLNYILITNGPNGNPVVNKLCENLRLNENDTIKEIYKLAIEKVREKFKDYVGHVFPDKIMVVVDETWEPNKNATENSNWKVRLKKTTGPERLFTGYQYKLTLRTHWLEQWSPAHLHAAIFSQMLRIEKLKGTVLDYNEEFQSAMEKTFGEHYLNPERPIDDILTDKIDFKGLPIIVVQTTMDEVLEHAVEEPEKDEAPVEEQTEIKAVK